jgi:glycerol uptake facilitator-like aquaporin
MGEKLAAGNVALALLANTIATGAALVALIAAFADISGAHLNPVVTLTDAIERRLPWLDAMGYVAVQIVGGVVGAMTAHAMFGLPVISVSATLATDGHWFSASSLQHSVFCWSYSDAHGFARR